MYNISDFEIDSEDIFQSELDQCPEELSEEVNFNELRRFSTSHTNLDCGTGSKNVEINQRISEQLLVELADENEFYSGSDRLIYVYEDCDYPEGIIGLVVSNEVEDIVFESGEELEIHYGSEMIGLCN